MTPSMDTSMKVLLILRFLWSLNQLKLIKEEIEITYFYSKGPYAAFPQPNVCLQWMNI